MNILLIISLLLFTGYAVLILYYRQGWMNIPNHKPQTSNYNPQTRISVIIPARNEEECIAACLDSVLDQSYAKEYYEVIVVDDHSTDATARIIQRYTESKIRYIDLSLHLDGTLNSYKKKAIEVGIEAASGELIVTTDADCIAGPDWLLSYADFFHAHQPVFIAAPVSIDCNNRFIEIFQALDFMTLQGITGASVHRNMHSMCNGANLAYTKEAFKKVDGFKGIDRLASGDDMLLMHKISRAFPGRLKFMKSKEAIVQTASVEGIGGFFNQRIRWASKATGYDDKRILIVLAWVYLFNLLLLVLPVLSIIDPRSFTIRTYPFTLVISLAELWVILLIFKTLVELYFLFPVAKFFRKQNLLFLFPFMQPFHILYTVIAGFLGTFGTYRWKGRKVK